MTPEGTVCETSHPRPGHLRPACLLRCAGTDRLLRILRLWRVRLGAHRPGGREGHRSCGHHRPALSRGVQAGHLEGAVNYDFSSGDFSKEISGLDRNSQYQIYGTDDQPKMASAVMRNAGSQRHRPGTLDAAKNTTGAKVVTD